MKRILVWILSVVLLGAFGAVAAGFAVYVIYARDLPDYRALAAYDPPVTTRVHAGDGRLLAEYATQNRLFVPIWVIPKQVRNAFIAAEDKNFYEHHGIDFTSIARALVTNAGALAEGRRPVGGSTITQQVAKNFLVGSEVSLGRKIREAILAFRIEDALTKDRILELYLNEIYLGFGSYGVAAAALNYFNKSLDDLTLGEAAFLAALPKGPNNYNPVTKPDAARGRRDWVIGRMLEDGLIDQAQAHAALAEPLTVRRRDEAETVNAPWFAEEVRREIVQRFGERALYEGGLSVRTSLDPRLQQIADRAIHRGLVAYDRRHGWRGPLGRVPEGQDLGRAIDAWPAPPGLGGWSVAVVSGVRGDGVSIRLPGGGQGTIPFSAMSWARLWHEGQTVGPAPRRPSDVLAVGDVVAVARAEGGERGGHVYALEQIPNVEGALVALDPHTGRVLAVVGGYDAEVSQFDRATQAWRQPGSAFKPFVYLTALEQGYTPASLILDAPFVAEQGPGLPLWRPQNYEHGFLGAVPMRQGIEKSRNLMTVRLADKIGMRSVLSYAQRFGIGERMQPMLSMALGAGEVTLLKLTAAYGMLANGGKRIQPTFIDRVQDRNGSTIFKADDRECPACEVGPGVGPPDLPDEREQLADPASVYQMISMLQGVVERGTGATVGQLHQPLAGKTGTTNDSNDTWFVGFSADLAVGVFVGFDQPRTLGPREQGSSAAAPIFKEFMADALKFYPATPFRVPPGIRFVRVSAATGLPPEPGDRNVILEAFKPGTEPHEPGPVVGDGSEIGSSDGPDAGAPLGAAPGAPPGGGRSGGGISSGLY